MSRLIFAFAVFVSTAWTADARVAGHQAAAVLLDENGLPRCLIDGRRHDEFLLSGRFDGFIETDTEADMANVLPVCGRDDALYAGAVLDSLNTWSLTPQDIVRAGMPSPRGAIAIPGTGLALRWPPSLLETLTAIIGVEMTRRGLFYLSDPTLFSPDPTWRIDAPGIRIIGWSQEWKAAGEQMVLDIAGFDRMDDRPRLCQAQIHEGFRLRQEILRPAKHQRSRCTRL